MWSVVTGFSLDPYRLFSRSSQGQGLLAGEAFGLGYVRNIS